MCRKSVLIVCTVLLACTVGCADRLVLQTSAVRTPGLGDVSRVAIVDFEGATGGQAIADLITLNFIRAGFDVVERDQIKDVVREASVGQHGFTDLSDADKARVLGKILNADVIITGQKVRQVPAEYAKDGDNLIYQAATLEIAARAFDAKTGKVVWTAVVNATSTAKTGKQLKVMDYINEPCRELVYSFRDPNYQDIAKVFEGEQIEAHRKSRGY